MYLSTKPEIDPAMSAKGTYALAKAISLMAVILMVLGLGGVLVVVFWFAGADFPTVDLGF